jgi:hypothetical protein
MGFSPLNSGRPIGWKLHRKPKVLCSTGVTEREPGIDRRSGYALRAFAKLRGPGEPVRPLPHAGLVIVERWLITVPKQFRDTENHRVLPVLRIIEREFLPYSRIDLHEADRVLFRYSVRLAGSKPLSKWQPCVVLAVPWV